MGARDSCNRLSIPGNGRLYGRPDDGLRNDDAFAVESSRRWAIELVAKCESVADAVAKSGVIDSGEQAVSWQAVGWLLHR